MIVHDIPSQKMTAWVEKQIEAMERDLKNIEATPTEDQNEARLKEATMQKRISDIETAKATYVFLAKMESVFGFMMNGESLQSDYDLLRTSMMKLEDATTTKAG